MSIKFNCDVELTAYGKRGPYKRKFLIGKEYKVKHIAISAITVDLVFPNGVRVKNVSKKLLDY